MRGPLVAALMFASTVPVGVGTAAAEPLVFTAGGLSPAGTVADDYWQAFGRDVVASSKGAIAPKLLTRGEIGSEDQILTGVRRNRIQVAINGFLALSSVMPELAVLSAPYLFHSKDEMHYVTERHLTPLLTRLFDEKDLVLLRVLPMGWMHVYSKTPAVTPADLKGRKVRVPADVASRYYLEALGYDLIPLASVDVVQSLQTGLTEAGTTVTLNYLWSGMAVEAKHLTLTAHSFLYTAFYAGKGWWRGLSDSDRALIEAAAGSGRVFADSMDRAEAEALAQSAAKGFTVHDLTPAERALWAEPTAAVTTRLVREIGGRSQEVVDAVNAGAAAFAARGNN
ncbi:MAG: TRAP transporter substrate-binding protein DctP [Rhodospirillaceae bacterium]|nr:TRAP transporter substrate-binding protein DctP [Rhodospirillaceae bacterium]